MSFVCSLFSCCFGASKDEKAEAEARHARIVSMYNSDRSTPESIISTPPPCYADIAHDRPFTTTDEKTASVAIEHVQPQYPPEARRLSVSSRSSVVSVPSTRLSDLTSTYTGRTRHVNNADGDEMSERNSSYTSSGWHRAHDSAPPSYYAGSERSITPTPMPVPPAAALLGTQHPVMQDGWFENLRTVSDRDRASPLRYPELAHEDR